ncbi:unnamed protein product [Orchesella dallaii]|uniref:Secreted protein n=1 Tax=Orchesella dallaii TaxID=48710 RepID=A0ABP1RIQ0_9HEXA
MKALPIVLLLILPLTMVRPDDGLAETAESSHNRMRIKTIDEENKAIITHDLPYGIGIGDAEDDADYGDLNGQTIEKDRSSSLNIPSSHGNLKPCPCCGEIGHNCKEGHIHAN